MEATYHTPNLVQQLEQIVPDHAEKFLRMIAEWKRDCQLIGKNKYRPPPRYPLDAKEWLAALTKKEREDYMALRIALGAAEARAIMDKRLGLA